MIRTFSTLFLVIHIHFVDRAYFPNSLIHIYTNLVGLCKNKIVMKKIIPIIIISFFFTSCDWHLGKTSDMESLLDYGFSDQPTKDVSSTESTDSPSTFKSTGTTHLGMDISHFLSHGYERQIIEI